MFTFKTYEEYDRMWKITHNSILYWKKVRQDAEGKICLQCDGSQTHYSIREAEEEMQDALKLLQDIENTPHYSWDGEEFVWVEAEEYPSSMIAQSSTLMNKVFPYDPENDLNNYTSEVSDEGGLMLTYHPPA